MSEAPRGFSTRAECRWPHRSSGCIHIVRSGGTSRLLSDLRRSWHRPPFSLLENREPSPTTVNYQPLERVLLTDGVGRTLFEEYAAHRAQATAKRKPAGCCWVCAKRRGRRPGHVARRRRARCRRGAYSLQQQRPGGGQPDRAADGSPPDHPRRGAYPSRQPAPSQRRRLCAATVNGCAQLRGGEGVFGIGTADGTGSQRRMCSPISRGRTCNVWANCGSPGIPCGRASRRIGRCPWN